MRVVCIRVAGGLQVLYVHICVCACAAVPPSQEAAGTGRAPLAARAREPQHIHPRDLPTFAPLLGNSESRAGSR